MLRSITLTLNLLAIGAIGYYLKDDNVRNHTKPLIIDGVALHCRESLSDSCPHIIRIALLSQLETASGEVLSCSGLIFGKSIPL